MDDRFLVHGQARLVYGINLARNTERYLTAEDAEPDYIFPQKNPENTRKKITNYWIKRWLTSRINYAPALEALDKFTSHDGAVSSELRTDAAPTQLNLDV